MGDESSFMVMGGVSSDHHPQHHYFSTPRASASSLSHAPPLLPSSAFRTPHIGKTAAQGASRQAGQPQGGREGLCWELTCVRVCVPACVSGGGGGI